MAPRYKYSGPAKLPKCRGTRCPAPRYRLAAIPLNPVTSERGGYPVDLALRMLKSAQEHADTDWYKALAKAGDVAQQAERVAQERLGPGPEGITAAWAKADPLMRKAVQMFSRLEETAGNEESQKLAGRLARHFELTRRRWHYRDTTWEAADRSRDRFYADEEKRDYRDTEQAARAREKLKAKGWKWVGAGTFRREKPPPPPRAQEKLRPPTDEEKRFLVFAKRMETEAKAQNEKAERDTQATEAVLEAAVAAGRNSVSPAALPIPLETLKRSTALAHQRLEMLHTAAKKLNKRRAEAFRNKDTATIKRIDVAREPLWEAIGAASAAYYAYAAYADWAQDLDRFRRRRDF